MPATEVLFWVESDGRSEVVAWLEELQARERQGYARCIARLQQLAVDGYELRRPAADLLRDGIYELRAHKGHVQFRLLYFFHGRNVAIVAHGIVKAGAAVPPQEIARALQRKAIYERDPFRHTYHKEVFDG